MPPKVDSIENAIQMASAAMDADPHLKGTDAAKKYGAIYQRLMARRRGRPASNTRGGHNKKLENLQDHIVQDYLLMLYHAGTSANLEALCNGCVLLRPKGRHTEVGILLAGGW
jgi:hypothetical protein